MDLSATGTNPYDFRSPVRERRLLAGRGPEIEQVDELLRVAAAGRPSHFSLFGPAGSGKTSLLNTVAEIATDRGLLGVKVRLRDQTVATTLDFFHAVHGAIFQRLIDLGALDETDPSFLNWALQTATGENSMSPANQQFELGWSVAARLNGKMVSDVPGTVIKRDLERLLSLGPAPYAGLVLCLDNAKLIDDNRDLAPSILEVADLTSRLTVVTAAESAGALQEAAPRAWAQIEVGPFSRGGVYDAVTRPIADQESATMHPNINTLADIRALTGGVPYEVTLVCHFIWEAVHRGEQNRFELSSAVIERVLEELGDRGRHGASEEIATFQGLARADFERIVRIAPYESLTVKQQALVRLMLKDYDDEDLEQVVAEIEDDLDYLAARGVVTFERDRFRLTGGRDARLYLKYAAQRYQGEKLRYHDQYPEQAAIACAEAVGRAVIGEAYGQAGQGGWLFKAGRPYEMGADGSGDWLPDVYEAISQGGLPILAQTWGSRVSFDQLAELSEAEKDVLFVGLLLQVDVHEVEHGELLTEADPDVNAEALAGEWLESHKDLLSRYGIQVLLHRVVRVPRKLFINSVIYAQLDAFSRFAYSMYVADASSVAEELVETALRGAEELVGEEPEDPIVQAEFAEALHRLAFMAAGRNDFDAALAYLERAEALSLNDDLWLLDFNFAYVLAKRGAYAEAATRCEKAQGIFDGYDGLVVLHVLFPTPEGWIPPNDRWEDVVIQGSWIGRLFQLQAAVLRTLAAQEPPESLDARLQELAALSTPIPLLRLGGWAELTIRGNAAAAATLFERAVDLASLEEAPRLRLELEFARATAGTHAPEAASAA